MIQPRVAVAHLGARKHYQEPTLFAQWGILEKFYTDFYAGNSLLIQTLRQNKIYKRLPKILKKTLDRYDPTLDKTKIVHFPGLGYQFFKSFHKAPFGRTAGLFTWVGREFCQRIIARGLGQANLVYGFNWESLELFNYAKTRNIHCILDQTIAERSLLHQLLLTEEKNWPGWSLLPFTVDDNDLKLLEREQNEHQLADKIICGSEFVRDSLIAQKIDSNKISVVALGRRHRTPIPQHNYSIQKPQERGDGLRILFVGSVSLRKGIPYLLEALQQLKGQIPFTCKVAGSIQIKSEQLAKYMDVCDFLGQVPRSQINDLYTWADVFVLPSICEGSAMVTYEALSWGLPVITTYNAGSIIRDKIDGYIVPIRDSQAIAHQLLTLFANNCFLNKNEDIAQYFDLVYRQNLEILFQAIHQVFA